MGCGASTDASTGGTCYTDASAPAPLPAGSPRKEKGGDVHTPTPSKPKDGGKAPAKRDAKEEKTTTTTTATAGAGDQAKPQGKGLNNKQSLRSAMCLVGVPGAGLTTQAKLVEQRRPDLVVVDVGVLLRTEVAKKTPTGAAIHALISAGVLVPDLTVVDLVKQTINEPDKKDKGVVLLGFPRSIGQAKLFEEHVVTPLKVISVEVPTDVARARLDALPFEPGESADSRMAKEKNYHAGTAAALGHYASLGKTAKVDGSGDPQQVHESLMAHIAEMDELMKMVDEFHVADKDGSGEIDMQELKDLFVAHGRQLTDADIKRLLAQYDEDNSGLLSFEEFVPLVQRELWIHAKLEESKRLFESVDKDKSGEIDTNELAQLLALLGLPNGKDEVDEVQRRYDVDGGGTISFDEFTTFIKESLVDLTEMRAALEAADAAQQEAEYEMSSGTELQVTNPPGFLAEAMIALVEENRGDLQRMVGLDTKESDTLAGILVKLVQDMVSLDKNLAEDPLAAYPAENKGRELLKEIANKKGWDWKNAEGAKPNSLEGMDEWYHAVRERLGIADGDMADVMAAVLKENIDNVDAMSEKFGAAFDECMIAILAGIVCWDSKLIDTEAIMALDEPAIFAFSFGTGDKIGPALEMETKVGPGCETPGKTNEGLAEEIKKILAVRPMPVYAQWEIADALCHGGDGHPRPESFWAWDFGDAAEGGDPSKAEEWYQRIENFEVAETGEKVKVYKSLPIWPLAIKKKLVEHDALADAGTMKKYYLSTVGVLQQNQELWDTGLATRPKSVIIVGQMDHEKRCQKLVKDLVLPTKSGEKATLGLPAAEMPVYRFYPDDWSMYSCDKFGYDPKSTQKWTRARALYVMHEATARGMQYVREDFGPLPIHKDLVRRKAHGQAFAAAKLVTKDQKLAQLLGPTAEWD